MTSIAVVKKKGEVTIAADSLTKWGSGKESAQYIVNSSKILKIADNYVAIAGNATFKLILADYFQNITDIKLSNVNEIFSTWNTMHSELKKGYYLNAEEDKDDSIESTRIDTLIANQYGIFGVSGHRTVQEFSKFYAYGSGSDYALGCLWSTYNDDRLSSQQLGKLAIEAAAEFDDATGLPIDCHTITII